MLLLFSFPLLPRGRELIFVSPPCFSLSLVSLSLLFLPLLFLSLLFFSFSSAAQSYVEDRITALRESVHASLRAAQSTTNQFPDTLTFFGENSTSSMAPPPAVMGSMNTSTGMTIVHTLFSTMIQDAHLISAFITDNIGENDGSVPESNAPASWRDLDDIFDGVGISGGENVLKHKASPPKRTMNIRVACERLQVALMQLNNVSASTESKAGKEGKESEKTAAARVVQLAETAAHDFCTGVRSEVEHLVDNIMERQPFVKQLEQMLAKELEKTRDYDDVSNRYEKELASMRSEIATLKKKDVKNKKLLGKVTGDMRAQLELSRRLLGPRTFLFKAGAGSVDQKAF